MGLRKLGDLTEAKLRQLYLVERRSQWEIAAQFGVTQGAIFYWMRKWGIPARELHAARVEKLRVRFVGPGNPRWNGGKARGNGYVLVKRPEHPKADNRGYVREHILVWEKAHRTSVPPGWHIHHKNGIKDDNRPENLEAMSHRHHRDVIPGLLRRIASLERQIEELNHDNARTSGT